MPFISPSRAFIIRGYVYIPHAIKRATRRDRGARRVLYAIPLYNEACVWAFYAVLRGVWVCSIDSGTMYYQ